MYSVLPSAAEAGAGEATGAAGAAGETEGLRTTTVACAGATGAATAGDGCWGAGCPAGTLI